MVTSVDKPRRFPVSGLISIKPDRPPTVVLPYASAARGMEPSLLHGRRGGRYHCTEPGVILEIIIGFLVFDGVLAFLFWLLTAGEFGDADDRTIVASRDRATDLFRAR